MVCRTGLGQRGLHCIEPEKRMNRPAFLTLTAVGVALSLGLIAVNFSSVAP
jgi:hypothetical protein